MAGLPLGSVCSDQDVPHVRLVPARPGWTHRQHGQQHADRFGPRARGGPSTGAGFPDHQRLIPALAEWTRRLAAVMRWSGGRSPRARGSTGVVRVAHSQFSGTSPCVRGVFSPGRSPLVQAFYAFTPIDRMESGPSTRAAVLPRWPCAWRPGVAGSACGCCSRFGRAACRTRSGVRELGSPAPPRCSSRQVSEVGLPRDVGAAVALREDAGLVA